MIIAGIGCRRGCPAAEIVALIRQAEALTERVDALATPAFKRDEPGLREAAQVLGLTLRYVADEAMAAAQAACVTRSAAAEDVVGFASVAEAAALSEGGVLLLPRIASARATCAVARAGGP